MYPRSIESLLSIHDSTFNTWVIQARWTNKEHASLTSIPKTYIHDRGVIPYTSKLNKIQGT